MENGGSLWDKTKDFFWRKVSEKGKKRIALCIALFAIALVVYKLFALAIKVKL